MSVLLQLSAGQGPKECGEAVARAVKKIMKDASAAKIALEIVEHNQTSEGTRSVVFALEDSAEAWARKWEGSMLWICPLRSGSARKNWYFSGSVFAPQSLPSFNPAEVVFQTCRSSGAGGQHVNTTNSAVQAVHTPSGLSVRVENERSQHANKKRAVELLQMKMAQHTAALGAVEKSQQRRQHHLLERGNPVRVFHGTDFIEK